MKNIGLAIAELQRSERGLSRRLRAVAARHHADQDIYHLAMDLARWSDDHVEALARHGRRYGVRLPARTLPTVTRVAQERLSEALRYRPQAVLLLIADLRRVHRSAAGTSLDWELLAQGAQALKDDDLLELATACHPQTLRQMRWANAMLKELSPQALAG
jgi:hypothetical protein